MTFPEFLRELGIIPPEIITPGRWTRVATDTHPRKKNANIKLCEDMETGFAIDFSAMSEAAVWRANEKADKPKYDHAAAQARIDARKREETKGIQRARMLYSEATDLLHAAHPYLQRKLCTMEGARGIKVDAKGWLVIPMWRNSRLISCQRISETGEKRFVFGAPTKAATFRVWRPGSCVTVLCEGLATGLTIFRAMPNASVIVCFSAANLIAVAERETWHGMVAVAGDEDHWTMEDIGKNPGRESACRSAEIIGCGATMPGCDGTDWNDFFTERLEILKKSEAEKQWAHSPQKLIESALMPIRTSIMDAAKFIP